MTEAEWSTCTDPHPLLMLLRDGASERKRRLFAVACCRRVRHLLADSRSWQAVEVAERYADGAAGDAELEAAYREAYRAADTDPEHPPDDWRGSCRAEAAPVWAATRSPWPKGDSSPEEAVAYDTAVGCAGTVGYADGYLPERAAQAVVLRDLSGPLPFRPVVAEPSWLTSTVVSLARSIYDARSFELMPVLADALMDAGCNSDEVLDHCRGPGPHSKGCWVIDMVLSRS